MTLLQLQYLVVLADELNFTRAAERAHIAQPAMSRQIRKLEDELGTALVDRTSRRVRMTPVGVDLVDRARRILQQVDQARAAVSSRETLEQGRLTIGVTHSPGRVDLAELLSDFHGRHPGVELVVREDLSTKIADQLEADEIDLGVISAARDHHRSTLMLAPLASEPLVLVVAPDHALAAGRAVDLSAVASETFVLYPTGATVRDSMVKYAQGRGLSLRVAFESNDPNRIRAIAATGLAVGALPLTDVERPGPRVATLRLTGDPLSHEVFLAYRSARRLSSAALKFAELITPPPWT